MAKAGFTGPVLALGNVSGSAGSNVQPREYSDEVGPSIFWGGTSIPATGANFSKDRAGPGAIPVVTVACPIRTINAALGLAGAVTVAGLPTAGVPLVNITTYALGRAPGVPVTIGGVAVTNAVALDMGLDPCGTNVSGAVTLATIANAWRYRVGQWICLLACPANSTQMTQITAINASTGVLTVSPVPAATIGTGATGPQIALTNRFNQNLYGASGPPSSISSEAPAGTARISIPEIGNTRGLGVTAAAATTNGNVLIQGIDGWGVPQSEIITTVAGTTVYGKKTYDIFISAIPQFTDGTGGHNLTVVTSDFIGFPISVMDASSLVIGSLAYGATALILTGGTANVTIIPADTSNPATTTTGDPRGGIQLSAAGPGATPPGTALVLAAGNVLTIDQRLNPLQVARADVVNVGPLLGVAPV